MSNLLFISGEIVELLQELPNLAEHQNYVHDWRRERLTHLNGVLY
jgi:hypothetical protein